MKFIMKTIEKNLESDSIFWKTIIDFIENSIQKNYQNYTIGDYSIHNKFDNGAYIIHSNMWDLLEDHQHNGELINITINNNHKTTIVFKNWKTLEWKNIYAIYIPFNHNAICIIDESWKIEYNEIINLIWERWEFAFNDKIIQIINQINSINKNNKKQEIQKTLES